MQYVATWGSNNLNQLNLPFEKSGIFYGNLNIGSTGLIKLAVGEYHSIGIYNNGYITGWGDNSYDQFSFQRLPDFNYYVGAKSIDANQGTSYIVDKFGYIHGYGRDFIFGNIDTGNVINWNFYLGIGSNPTPFTISKYPKNFSAVSAGSGYVLGLHNSGFITGWGTEVERITGQTVGALRTGESLIFNRNLDSGSYVTINLTGTLWTGFRAIWRQSQNNTTFSSLSLYNSGNAYTSGLAIADGGIGRAIYSGYLDSDKSYLQVILTGTGVASGRGVLGVIITGYFGIWQNDLKVIDYRAIKTINSLGFITGVSAGFNHALAMISGGQVTGWGDNSLNQLNFDTSIFSGIKISTKANHNLVLGRPKPIVTKISKVNNNNWIIDFSGVGTTPTALTFQRSVNKQTWININGTIMTTGKISGGFFPNDDQDYFCRLIEQKNNNFYTGSVASFNPYYFYFDPSKDSKLYNWGGVVINPLNKIKFFPALGNNDYTTGSYTSPPTSSGQGYLTYFNNLLGDLVGNTSSNKRYYDVIIGDCHFFILDSDPVTGGIFRDGDPWNNAGIGNPSFPNSNDNYVNTQKTWFNNRIQNSTSKWKLVIFHHPPQTSEVINYGIHNLSFDNGWRLDLANAVFNGHARNYEKFIKIHNNNSVYYFVNGAGGSSITDFGPILQDSVTQLSEYGFTKIKVYDDALEICFNAMGGLEKDNTIIGNNNLINLKNIFAIVSDFGNSNNPSDIISIGLDYKNPVSNYYTSQVSLAIKNISPDAIFTAGNNSYDYGTLQGYGLNVEPFYKNYYTGNVLTRNEITDIPETIKNVNIYDANAGYKTNIVLTEIPLATGVPLEPVISGETPEVICEDFVFDD
jgi:alpha-tubulin suppressor-like RCC1 family protein